VIEVNFSIRNVTLSVLFKLEIILCLGGNCW